MNGRSKPTLQERRRWRAAGSIPQPRWLAEFISPSRPELERHETFPAVSKGRLLIRAPFHDPAPEGVMEVVVMPKMSFGTGHHATTWLVSRAVPMGVAAAGGAGARYGQRHGPLCWSIVAAKCGAEHVDAVDIDDWADASCRENIAANGVADRITPMLGDVLHRWTALRFHSTTSAATSTASSWPTCRPMPPRARRRRRSGDERISGTRRSGDHGLRRKLGLRPVATAVKEGAG